jgi:hypothetical protein
VKFKGEQEGNKYQLEFIPFHSLSKQEESWQELRLPSAHEHKPTTDTGQPLRLQQGQLCDKKESSV